MNHISDSCDDDVQILIDAYEHSSKMIWEVFANASVSTIITYAVKEFGADEIKETLEEAEKNACNENPHDDDDDVKILLSPEDHSSVLSRC